MILDLWAEGLSAIEIAARVGISRWKVYNEVRDARAAGDPRAVSRQPNRPPIRAAR